MKTVILPAISNVFMTFAWHGHLRNHRSALRWDYLAGFGCMILAVFFVFREWRPSAGAQPLAAPGGWRIISP